MLVSLKRVFLIVVMALALLAGLFGWSAKMMTTPSQQHHYGAQTTQTRQLASNSRYTCPPPPFIC